MHDPVSDGSAFRGVRRALPVRGRPRRAQRGYTSNHRNAGHADGQAGRHPSTHHSHGEPLMTAAAVPADLVPLRPAWRSLLWFAPLTVLWTLMIYSWPAIPASGVPTTTHQLAAHGLIALGLWLGLEHTSLTPAQRRATWLAIMIPDTLWFAVAWSAAINGVFRTGALPLPLLPLAIFLPVIIGAPPLLFSKRIGQCSMRCQRAGSSRF